MANTITEYEKDRMLKTFRHWYSSHKKSLQYFEENGNEKSADYHRNQLNTLKWMANIINKIEVVPDYNLDDDSNDCPF